MSFPSRLTVKDQLPDLGSATIDEPWARTQKKSVALAESKSGARPKLGLLHPLVERGYAHESAASYVGSGGGVMIGLYDRAISTISFADSSWPV